MRREGTSDEERRDVPACRTWFCHVAYMRTYRKDIREAHTPVLGPHHGNDLHACQRRGRRDSVTLGNTSIGPGLDHDRDQQCASRCRCLVPDLLRLRLHDPMTRGYPCRSADRRCMYSSSRGLDDVDSLDGTAKGDGDTDDENDATWECGRSA